MVMLKLCTIRVTLRPLLLTNCRQPTCRFSSNTATSQEPPSPKFVITPQNVTIGEKTFPTDDWTNVTPKVLSTLERKLHQIKHHPLGLIKARIVDFMYLKYRNIRGNPLFSVYDNLSPGNNFI